MIVRCEDTVLPTAKKTDFSNSIKCQNDESSDRNFAEKEDLRKVNMQFSHSSTLRSQSHFIMVHRVFS